MNLIKLNKIVIKKTKNTHKCFFLLNKIEFNPDKNKVHI